MGVIRLGLPRRFGLFLLGFAAASVAGASFLDVRIAVLIGFDVAAAAVLASLIPLWRRPAEAIRRAAGTDDPAGAALLVLIATVVGVVLTTVALELGSRGRPEPTVIVLVIATLALTWTLLNAVFALHYAHIYYQSRSMPDGGEGDYGGLAVPGTDQPGYPDFAYFALTLGMTFQTADIAITGPEIRRVALIHAITAFVFNLGVIAFSVNVLGG